MKGVLVMKFATSIFFSIILLTSISHAQSGWYTQNSGTDRFLFDVHFVDQNNGWVCGQTGTVLHTTNGGVTWTIQNAPANNGYYCIYFVNNLTGWAVGSSGSSEFIHTTDGGNTWVMQTSPTPNSTSDVYFLNADTGWAVGGKPRTFTDPIRDISYTTNGGATWTAQYSASNEDPLGEVYFIDENQGWAVGSMSTIMHTSDGGSNWSFQMSGTGYEFNDVYFVNPDTGWVVGEDLSIQHYAVIFKTMDGGNTWDFQTFGSDTSFQGIQFVNDSTGWIVGGSNTTAVILYTNDGGTTWIPQNPGTSNFLSEFYFTDVNNGWAVGFDGSIVHTSTGGVVGIQNRINNIPEDFVLYNNYPNPFNPSTTIQYEIPRTTRVVIIIYDMLEQQVKTLVDEDQSSGQKSVSWDGTDQSGNLVSSGIYFYKLHAGDFIETKKMVLMK
jgi:photosystem II stability/assembly factor-like uncharacterized protein